MARMAPGRSAVALVALLVTGARGQSCLGGGDLLLTTTQAVTRLAARVDSLTQTVSQSRSMLNSMRAQVAYGNIRCATSTAPAMGLTAAPRCIRSGFADQVCYESSNAGCEACIAACPDTACFAACRFEGSSQPACRSIAATSNAAASLAAGCGSLTFEPEQAPDCVASQLLACDSQVSFAVDAVSKLTGDASMTPIELNGYAANQTCICYSGMDLSSCDPPTVMNINRNTADACIPPVGYPLCVDPDNVPPSVCGSESCRDDFVQFMIADGRSEEGGGPRGMATLDPILVRHVVLDNACFQNTLQRGTSADTSCAREEIGAISSDIEFEIENLMVARQLYGPSQCNARVLVMKNVSDATFFDLVGSITPTGQPYPAGFEKMYSTLDHRAGLTLPWATTHSDGSGAHDGNCTVARSELGCSSGPLPMPVGWEMAPPGPGAAGAARAHCWGTDYLTTSSAGGYETNRGPETSLDDDQPNPAYTTVVSTASVDSAGALEVVAITDAMRCQGLMALAGVSSPSVLPSCTAQETVAINSAALTLLASSPECSISNGLCSDACETEFINGCMPHWTSEFGGDAMAAFSHCRGKIDRAEGPIDQFCVPLCESTASMLDTRGVAADGSSPSPPSGGADCTAGVSLAGYNPSLFCASLSPAAH